MKKLNNLKNNNVGAGPVSARQENKGITLIALIITIIVMLILVTVSIQVALNTGLFDSAGKATQDYKAEQQKEQELGNGQVTIDNKTYASIDDYVKEMQAEKITFYIKYNNNGEYISVEYTVSEGTTWEQFLSQNQVPHHVENGEIINASFSLIDEYSCQALDMPDEALGAYTTVNSGGGPFLEEGVNFQTGPWIFPNTLIEDGTTYMQ